ncbi:MAG: tetratricopeptide repeat protein [Acidobacteriota bacterium]
MELYPDHEAARNNLALLYGRFERYDEAIEQLEELIRRGEAPMVSYINLARSYALLGKFEKGYEVLQELLRRHPDSASGYRSLGIHLAQWGRLDEALAALERAKELAPGRPDIQGDLFDLYLLRGQFETAGETARQIGSSRDPFMKLFLGPVASSEVDVYLGRSRPAIDLLAKAADAFPRPNLLSAQLRILLSSSLLELGEAKGALEQARQAQSAGRGEAAELGGLANVALAQARLGRRAAAEAAAEQLERRGESFPADWNRRRQLAFQGELALALGDAAAAIRALSEAESLLPPHRAVTSRFGTRWARHRWPQGVWTPPPSASRASSIIPMIDATTRSSMSAVFTFSAKSTSNAATSVERGATIASSSTTGRTVTSTVSEWPRRSASYDRLVRIMSPPRARSRTSPRSWKRARQLPGA